MRHAHFISVETLVVHSREYEIQNLMSLPLFFHFGNPLERYQSAKTRIRRFNTSENFPCGAILCLDGLFLHFLAKKRDAAELHFETPVERNSEIRRKCWRKQNYDTSLHLPKLWLSQKGENTVPLTVVRGLIYLKSDIPPHCKSCVHTTQIAESRVRRVQNRQTQLFKFFVL